MKQVSGKIIILVNDKPKMANRIQYGFVKVKGEEDVFFNSLTAFEGGVSFENLKIGDKVCIHFKQTRGGPYAKRLALLRPHIEPELPSPPPSASL